MNQPFDIKSVCHVLKTYQAPPSYATQRENRNAVTRVKAFSRMQPIVGCVAEFVAGVFVVFYLLAAFALGAAVLFFTLCH